MAVTSCGPVGGGGGGVTTGGVVTGGVVTGGVVTGGVVVSVEPPVNPRQPEIIAGTASAVNKTKVCRYLGEVRSSEDLMFGPEYTCVADSYVRIYRGGAAG